MSWITLLILQIITSYLLGAIPTAYILGRLLKGIDIRKFGSGNVGATNAFRVLGKGPGIFALILDILKGFLAAAVIGGFYPRGSPLAVEEIAIISGLSAVCGHNWTIFLGFKGGKGIATTLGVLLGLTTMVPGLMLVLGLLILTWLAVFLMARIISVASVITAIALPIYMVLFRQPNALLILGLILSVLAVVRHKSNILRVLQGKEQRLSFRKPA